MELNGGGHGTEERRRADATPTAHVESGGYGVLRFWDNEVLTNIDGVLERIAEYI